MKRVSAFVVTIIVSILLQYFINIEISEEFVNGLLTFFSILFGFYITSLSVFATSRYLVRLYAIQSEKDNRKTLLDELLEEFSFAIYLLLLSMFYGMILAIAISQKSYEYYTTWFAGASYGVILINFYWAWHSVRTFIRVTRQSAKSGT